MAGSDAHAEQNHATDNVDLSAYVVAHIGEAIENGWIVPYYQPVIRTLTGKLCGFEALARWDDPQYGLLSPAVFIPALEEAKLIHLLDSCIIRQVCMQLNNRKKCGFPIVPVSLNLSRLDFVLCEIFGVVEQATYEFGIPRRMLNIEITESTLGADPEFMTIMMRKFQNAGYEVWMDDFGSGYSSLNVLKDFDFDELKIDMNFLSSFNEKSKSVLASVVDMAKKLGIQTLAEGVETEEHRDFLRSIGCEKMQGYLFGKPEPWRSGRHLEGAMTFEMEAVSEYEYISKVGAVNMLSLSEHDLSANNSTESYMTSMPIGIIEYCDDTYRIIDYNPAFQEALAKLGIPSVAEAERLSNDPSRPFGRTTRHLMKTIERDTYARFDLTVGGAVCVIRARHITSHNGKMALILSFGDTVIQDDQKRHDHMGDLLSTVFSIYDLVNIIHLDERSIESVFDNLGLDTPPETIDFDSIVHHYAETDVYIDDRQRYLDFMDHDTMFQRVIESGESYLIDFFRLRQDGGNYAWKLFCLFPLPERPDNDVLLCIRGTHWKSDELLHRAFGKHQEDSGHGSHHSLSTITDGSLWRAIMHGHLVRLFWKNTQRQFVGANQAFLDYYGFESVDAILGKTDEDMGWHIDPKPFMDNELRVLNEGIPIESALGHCIVNGENRAIVASKYPVYRNGRIVGLMGCFLDAGSDKQDGADISALTMRDSVTDTLNYTGLEAATWEFVNSYKRHGIDFGMISISLDNFDEINAGIGSEFGDKVLKRVADELFAIVGRQRVVAHVFASRFVILSQDLTDEELQGFCDEIESRIKAIAQVDGTPCTVYALASYARFSEYGDADAMKKHNREQRVNRREAWVGKSSDEDLITSSLLGE